LKNLNYDNFKEVFKNLKRDIIAENLQLDKMEKREKDSGYNFYMVKI